jgi:hypothetical protein
MTCTHRLGAALLVGLAMASALASRAPADDPQPTAADVEFFEKQVRPLLVARCHECHSGAEPKGSLRLDSRAGVLAGGDTGPAVVPGKADESLLVDAVRYGELYKMPPKSQLPEAEIAVLIQWVERGAPWGAETADAAAPAVKEFDLEARKAHWCFQPLADAVPPAVDAEAWIKTPVDRFILAKLEGAGLRPAEPADKRTLLRRVTFDLTGLPPTPAELAAFLADESPDAYAAVVDRLLASPRYGERWARHWLDLVRYSETYGHEFDFDIPHAYRYRDYVIRALNDDLPYDQFVVEHVAGDLLPAPRMNPAESVNESILATGWYHFGEALHSPVDVRADEANRIDNQIDVFSKTFLGLTVSCARCHDHKFDAISTKDYYALAGYLQSSRYQQAPIDLDPTCGGAVCELVRLAAEQNRACTEVAKSVVTPRLEQLAAIFAQGGETHAAVAGAWGDGAQVVADFRGADFGDWHATGQAFGQGPGKPLAWSLAASSRSLPARLLVAPAAHSALISRKLQGVLRSPTIEITQPTIWYRLYGDGGRVRLIVDGLQLIRNPIYGGLEFSPSGHDAYWHPQDVSKWVGHRAYVELVDDGDGYLAVEQIVQSSAAPPEAAPNPLLAAVRAEAASTTGSDPLTSYRELFRSVLADWVAHPAALPDDAQARAAILTWMLDAQPPGADQAAAASAALAAINERRQELESRIAAPRYAPAMLDGTAENERVFIRGNHKTLGDEVPRRMLEALGGTLHAPPATGSGRLELARQLVSPECPLVPRVIVNRLWHHHFGEGLARSPDNLGVMGQPPTHPELLDWLARELVSHRWSLKHVHRLMVLSNTYRMASRAEPAVEQVDPRNEHWHRMNVRRLEAESIRDAILFTSGRLDLTMYGPGVMPHLTEFMSGRGRPAASGPLDGDGRRSIYLAVRRNFLSPMFLAFDYPTPFTTIGRRGTSNVPAQALVMMNNPFVVEQAQHWARRIAASETSAEERVRAMYLAALAREPDETERRAAIEFTASGDEHAWTELAHVLYNVKEFIFIR